MVEVLIMRSELNQDIAITQAKLPSEVELGSSSLGCPGDGCNADQGGCSSDASCGQDC